MSTACTKTRNTNPKHRNSTEQPGTAQNTSETAQNTCGTARNSPDHLRNTSGTALQEHQRNSPERTGIEQSGTVGNSPENHRSRDF
jgi:hypothetical protein